RGLARVEGVVDVRFAAPVERDVDRPLGHVELVHGSLLRCERLTYLRRNIDQRIATAIARLTGIHRSTSPSRSASTTAVPTPGISRAVKSASGPRVSNRPAGPCPPEDIHPQLRPRGNGPGSPGGMISGSTFGRSGGLGWSVMRPI